MKQGYLRKVLNYVRLQSLKDKQINKHSTLIGIIVNNDTDTNKYK